MKMEEGQGPKSAGRLYKLEQARKQILPGVSQFSSVQSLSRVRLFATP